MTLTRKATDLSRFCSMCARQANLDAAGSAYTYTHVLAVEVPLPWPATMYTEPGVLPQELLDLRRVLVEAYQRGESMNINSFAIAPDTAYSVPGYRRVISYRRPDQPFATFLQDEYLVPEAEAGPLCWALLVDHSALPRFARWQQPSVTRDLMICTHGSVDAACAKFGIPLYRQLRQLAAEIQGLRVWRISHFGGHVFAPTLIDMPEFRYWGYVDSDDAELLVSRSGDGLDLRDNYRGWAGLESPLLQVAERELFVRHGWTWMEYRKSGRVLACAEVEPGHEQPAWAEVRIDYATPNGSVGGAYTARVELACRAPCIASTGDTEPYPYPQYVVTRLEAVAKSRGQGIQNREPEIADLNYRRS